jgi:hypothetical protein
MEKILPVISDTTLVPLALAPVLTRSPPSLNLLTLVT